MKNTDRIEILKVLIPAVIGSEGMQIFADKKQRLHYVKIIASAINEMANQLLPECNDESDNNEMSEWFLELVEKLSNKGKATLDHNDIYIAWTRNRADHPIFGKRSRTSSKEVVKTLVEMGLVEYVDANPKKPTFKLI